MSKRVELVERDKVACEWGKRNLAAVKAEAKALGIRTYTGQFYRYLRDRYYKNRTGTIGAIAFRMPRHAVFVHKGVGRGYPVEAVNGGTLGITKSKTIARLRDRGFNKTAIAMYMQKQQKSSTNPLKGKGRKPKPWFNPVIDRNLPGLADELAKADADILSSNIFID